MDKISTKKVYIPNNQSAGVSSTAASNSSGVSFSVVENTFYTGLSLKVDSKQRLPFNSFEVITDKKLYIEPTIERVSQWFLSLSSMSHKKLQKLCYYAYCWFIVFFNDIESISENNTETIHTLCPERFQAWIHGPVLPSLYRRYKDYGWHDIPKVNTTPSFPKELESLLQQVWDAYGIFTADELETISHGEAPWINARKGLQSGEACSNEISDYDILRYYSALG